MSYLSEYSFYSLVLTIFFIGIEEADGASPATDRKVSDSEEAVLYNDTKYITTRPNSFPDQRTKIVLFPYLNKGFFELNSRVKSGDAFCVRDAAVLCMDRCTGSTACTFTYMSPTAASDFENERGVQVAPHAHARAAAAAERAAASVGMLLTNSGTLVQIAPSPTVTDSPVVRRARVTATSSPVGTPTPLVAPPSPRGGLASPPSPRASPRGERPGAVGAVAPVTAPVLPGAGGRTSPAGENSGKLTLSCGLNVDSDFVQYNLKDCVFSGIIAASFKHSFLDCSITGGGLEAKPGCGLYVGGGVGYNLLLKQVRIVAEPYPVTDPSIPLPEHITGGYAICVRGPCRVRLVGSQIKGGVGLFAAGKDCIVDIEGGSIVGKDFAIVCDSGAVVTVSKNTTLQGELQCSQGGNVKIKS